MKKTLLTSAILFLTAASFAQTQPPIDTTKVYTIKLEIKAADEGLFMFLLESAPAAIMKTPTPANQIEGLIKIVAGWKESAQGQINKKKPKVEGK